MTATRPDPSIDLSELERDYIVKRELGRGGMGSVFLARHRTAGHDVAIKVISSKHIADADAGDTVRPGYRCQAVVMRHRQPDN